MMKSRTSIIASAILWLIVAIISPVFDPAMGGIPNPLPDTSKIPGLGSAPLFSACSREGIRVKQGIPGANQLPGGIGQKLPGVDNQKQGPVAQCDKDAKKGSAIPGSSSLPRDLQGNVCSLISGQQWESLCQCIEDMANSVFDAKNPKLGKDGKAIPIGISLDPASLFKQAEQCLGHLGGGLSPNLKSETGDVAAGSKVLYVFDVSDSMQGKIGQARRVVDGHVSKLDPSVETGLVTFSGCPLARIAYQVEVGLGKNQEIISAVYNTPIYGNTALGEAIRRGNQIASQLGSCVNVVLVTDGADTCGGKPVFEAANLAGQWSRLHVINYGGGQEVRSKLGQVAMAGHGAYCEAKSAKDLRSCLDQLGDPNREAHEQEKNKGQNQQPEPKKP